MKQTTRITLGFVALALSAGVAAQNLYVEGVSEPFALDPDAPVRIDPVTGDVTVTLQDELACEGSGPDVGGAQITSFSATPKSQDQGGTVEFTWTSSQAMICIGTGDLPGWAEKSLTTSGTFALPIGFDVTAGKYQAGLTCFNEVAAHAWSPKLGITVTEPSGDCATQPPPSGLTRDTTFKHNSDAPTRNWTDIYGAAFPGFSANTTTLAIKRNRYGALLFNTNDLAIGQKGRVHFDGDTFPFGHAPPLVVISQCPGDFGPQPDSRCRQIPTFGLIPFRWSETSIATANRCPLDIGKTYYMNLVPTDTIPNGSNLTWICDGSTTTIACGSITRADGG